MLVKVKLKIKSLCPSLLWSNVVKRQLCGRKLPFPVLSVVVPSESLDISPALLYSDM